MDWDGAIALLAAVDEEKVHLNVTKEAVALRKGMPDSGCEDQSEQLDSALAAVDGTNQHETNTGHFVQDGGGWNHRGKGLQGSWRCRAVVPQCCKVFQADFELIHPPFGQRKRDNALDFPGFHLWQLQGMQSIKHNKKYVYIICTDVYAHIILHTVYAVMYNIQYIHTSHR